MVAPAATRRSSSSWEDGVVAEATIEPVTTVPMDFASDPDRRSFADATMTSSARPPTRLEIGGQERSEERRREWNSFKDREERVEVREMPFAGVLPSFFLFSPPWEIMADEIWDERVLLGVSMVHIDDFI
tara:strand:+ start:69 stop:458 length:390 start_codon:yes stop_codon:yes gene_type:complete